MTFKASMRLHRTLDAPSRTFDPIRALIAAILLRALDDLRLGPAARVGVLAWVNQTGNRQRPGSFEWCCEALSLNPDAVRRKYHDHATGADHRAMPARQ